MRYFDVFPDASIPYILYHQIVKILPLARQPYDAVIACSREVKRSLTGYGVLYVCRYVNHDPYGSY